MSDHKPGITFREVMSGGLALGATDPEAGAKAGEASRSRFTMHATITIDDIERFIADPDHLGGIEGRVDFPPIGADIPAPRGVFNLFSPTDRPDLKLMVYELAFSHVGRDYYLAGEKRVVQTSVDHLWHDTTTLYSLLHEGTDRTGPVVGAGVLSLGVTDLVKMVATMRATDAPTLAARADAIARFGRFFLGELWETYGPHRASSGPAGPV